MSHPLERFLAKIERRGKLPERDREVLLRLPGERRAHAAGDLLFKADDPAKFCIFMISGFVSRVRTLSAGRQIVAFHLPGDAVDLQSFLFSKTDHSLEANGATESYWVEHAAVRDAVNQSAIVRDALWLDTLVDAAVFREWTANLGQRRALQRMSHLFLEMSARFRAVGLVRNETFPCPLTQTNLAEALGLSLVHFNKTLQILRKGGLISTAHSISILKREELVQMCGFDGAYLHLDQSRVEDIVAADRDSGSA